MGMKCTNKFENEMDRNDASILLEFQSSKVLIVCQEQERHKL